MEDYKLVNAGQLDTDLTKVADAIRERGGTTDKLEFPEGFVTAVKSIPDARKETLHALLDRSITEFADDEITELGVSAFANCRKLVSIFLPSVTSGDGTMFQNCYALTNIHLPLLENAGNNAFQAIGATILDLPRMGSIYAGFVKSATNLTALILRRSDKAIALANINAFEGTPIESGTGYIYFPADKVDTYKAATNWSAFADQIRAIEDYPEITGGATE